MLRLLAVLCYARDKTCNPKDKMTRVQFQQGLFIGIMV